MWTEDAVRQIIGKVLAQKDQIGASFPHVAYDGKFRYENPPFWTAGFWPGILWMVYEKTGDESVKEIAIQIEEQLKDVLDDFFIGSCNCCTHPVGCINIITECFRVAKFSVCCLCSNGFPHIP